MQELFSDISELFVFDEADADYLDGPLSGWLRSKQDGSWFAYDCQPIIDGLLYHWTIVPASQKTDVAEVVQEAAKASTGRWLSVVEDRRSEERNECRLQIIENSRARPVTCSIRARP